MSSCNSLNLWGDAVNNSDPNGLLNIPSGYKFSDIKIYFYEKCFIRFSYGLGGFIGLLFRR